MAWAKRLERQARARLGTGPWGCQVPLEPDAALPERDAAQRRDEVLLDQGAAP